MFLQATPVHFGGATRLTSALGIDLHGESPFDMRQVKCIIDIPMKKAANCMLLAAFIGSYGGLGSIERCSVARMNARFLIVKSRFVPPFVPPLCL